MQGGKNANPHITHNLRSDDIDGMVREFIENESFRRTFRSDQVYLFHEILSMGANEDGRAITPEVMDDLTCTFKGECPTMGWCE